MSNTTDQMTTAEQLAAMPDDGNRYELVDGALHMISPGDRSSEVEAKALAWLEAGARVVLVVDPQTTTIRDYRSPSHIEAHSDGFVDLNRVLSGFQLDVAELFT